MAVQVLPGQTFDEIFSKVEKDWNLQKAWDTPMRHTFHLASVNVRMVQTFLKRLYICERQFQTRSFLFYLCNIYLSVSTLVVTIGQVSARGETLCFMISQVTW